MIPRIWLINVILALCAVFAGSMAYRVWVQEEPLGWGAPPSAPSVSAPEKTQPNKRTFLRESAYRVIAVAQARIDDSAAVVGSGPGKRLGPQRQSLVFFRFNLRHILNVT